MVSTDTGDAIPIRDLLGSEVLVKGADGKVTKSSLAQLDGKYLGEGVFSLSYVSKLDTLTHAH